MISEYEQIIDTNGILEVNKMHCKFGDFTERICPKEFISDIHDFAGVISRQNQNQINIEIANDYDINLDLPRAIIYQLIYSLIVNIVGLAKEKTTISLSIKQDNSFLEIATRYKGYYNTETQILKNIGKKKYINPYVLNLVDLIEKAKLFGALRAHLIFW